MADALAFLVKRLADADERRAAIVALGAFGSFLGWQARGPELAKTGDALRAKAASALVALVRSGGSDLPEDSLVESLATIAHPDARAQLEKAKADESLTPAARALAANALDRVNASIDRQAAR